MRMDQSRFGVVFQPVAQGRLHSGGGEGIQFNFIILWKHNSETQAAQAGGFAAQLTVSWPEHHWKSANKKK